MFVTVVTGVPVVPHANTARASAQQHKIDNFLTRSLSMLAVNPCFSGIAPDTARISSGEALSNFAYVCE